MKYIKILLVVLLFIGFAPFTSSVSASETGTVQKLWDGIDGRLIETVTTSNNEIIAYVFGPNQERILIKMDGKGNIIKKVVPFEGYGGRINIFKDAEGKVFIPVFAEPDVLMIYDENLIKYSAEKVGVKPDNDSIYSSFTMEQNGENFILNNLRQTHGTYSSNDLFVFTPEGQLIDTIRDKEFEFYPISKDEDGYLTYYTLGKYGKSDSPTTTNYKHAYEFYSEESVLYEYKDFNIAVLVGPNTYIVKTDKSGNIQSSTNIMSNYYRAATNEFALLIGTVTYRLDLKTGRRTPYTIVSRDGLTTYHREANVITDGKRIHILNNTGDITLSINGDGKAAYPISEKFVAISTLNSVKVYNRQSGDLIEEFQFGFNPMVFPGMKENEFLVTDDDSWAYYSIGNESTEPTISPTKVWKVTFNKEVDKKSVTPTSIYVKNKEDKKEDVTFTVDGTIVYVKAPDTGYLLGETYTLYITNQVKSMSGVELKKEATKEFTIR